MKSNIVVIPKIVCVFVLVSMLSACFDNLNDEVSNKNTLDSKIVLPDGDRVNGETEFRTIVTDDDLVKKVEYFVDAESIGSSDKQFYALEWDPYYFSDEAGTVSVNILMIDTSDNVFFGPTQDLTILPSSKQSLTLETENGLILQDSNQIKLTWSGLLDAEKYYVQLWDVSTPDELIIDQETNLTEQNVAELGVGSYQWRVKAANQYDNWGAWTDTGSFTVTGPIALFVNSFPDNGQIRDSNKPVFSWQASEFAETYHIEVARDISFTDIIEQAYITETSYQSVELLEGNYYWRVRPINSFGLEGQFSDVQSFSITGPRAPIVDTPSNNLMLGDTLNPVFSWQPVDNSVSYVFELATDKDFASVLSQSELLETSIQSGELELGQYYWRLRSKNELGFFGDWGQIYSFTISGPIPPVIIAPINAVQAATSQGVKLQWAGDEAVKYEIEIDDDADFSSSKSHLNVSGSSFVTTSYGKGLNHWRIRAVNPQGISGEWSSINRFTANVAPAPEGATIINGLIEEDEIWSKQNSPYYILGQVQVQLDVTVTIESGTEILFGDNAELEFFGTLKARGTVDQFIIFSSAYEQPKSGDWVGLQFKNGTNAVFDSNDVYVDGPILAYAKITNAGAKKSPAIHIDKAGPYIENNHIFNNLGGGIAVFESENLRISKNTISNNYFGIGVHDVYTPASRIYLVGNYISRNVGKTSYYVPGYHNPSVAAAVYIDNIRDNGIVEVVENIIVENENITLSVYDSRNWVAGMVQGNVIIQKNVFRKAFDSLVELVSCSCHAEFSSNLFLENKLISNERVTVSLDNMRSGYHPKISDNNFIGTLTGTYYYGGAAATVVTDNWWGTTDVFSIEDLIYHKGDYYSRGTVTYEPFLSEPSTVAPISPPNNVDVFPQSNTSIKISWDQNLESDTAGYRIYVDADGEWPYDKVLDAGSLLTYTLTEIDLNSGVFIGVSAYDTSYVEANDDPLTQINENQTAGNESLITKLTINE